MTTSEHGNKLLEFCDTLRAWERVVRVLRQSRRRESTLTHHQNHTARFPPGLVIPAKAEIHLGAGFPPSRE
ncbi:hypothetical protein [Endozoicomonas sp. 8E]|uniref:hypothetical protein n=1 Tax=Endozoicomonas sp. 8E TaxID=3035692 RepID=UPI0029390207|nr:hypothetical protein [Endozoicomonas sp. 8E]WOG27727.1 hypothetical protein P6910_24790 [Endozoicomonas sp. 8E]